MHVDPHRIAVPAAGLEVSALLLRPPDARALFVFAHGAGAGMAHTFMASAAEALAAQRIATLRYQFPSMERGSKRPDAPPIAHATVRAAVDAAAALAPGLPRVAGGKSFGGRMTSQAQAAEPLPGVRGLLFFGFPLHPAGTPARSRADHLLQVHCPMRFLQGTRDALADEGLMRAVLQGLGARASVEWATDADHGFHVPAKSGRRDAEVLDALVRSAASWIVALGDA
jgi:predicted alpha/beta-hydrolase family hydrolase